MTMRRIDLQPLEPFTSDFIDRTGAFNPGALEAATAIIEQVRQEGDGALRALTQKFDGVAIENFRVMDVPHKMAILGQMGELGEVSHEEHQKVVDQLQAAGLENVWLVGDEFKDIPCSYRKFQNVEEVKEALKANQPHDHYILIKGSNSVKLFQLPELL